MAPDTHIHMLFHQGPHSLLLVRCLAAISCDVSVTTFVCVLCAWVIQIHLATSESIKLFQWFSKWLYPVLCGQRWVETDKEKREERKRKKENTVHPLCQHGGVTWHCGADVEAGRCNLRARSLGQQSTDTLLIFQTHIMWPCVCLCVWVCACIRALVCVINVWLYMAIIRQRRYACQRTE